MTIRDRLAAIFRPRNAGDVPAPQPAWLLRHPWLQEAGVPITFDTAIQVSAVYGCCRLIVDCLASASIAVYRIDKGGKREVLHDDPVGYTLNFGAPVSASADALTSQAIEEALYWSALITGNGYAEIQWDNAQRFYALWPIEPSRVQPWVDGTGFYYRVSAPTGGATGQMGGSWTRVEARDMFHLRGPSLYGWVGDSPVFRAAKAIGIAQASQVFAAAYFANGGQVSGLLTSDKIVTKAQADQAKADWIEKFGGPFKANGIAVTGQGLKYQPISHNAQEAALVESRKFQVHEVARYFGVPTALLAENEAWTDLSALYIGFYRNALLPWAERFDSEATRKLIPGRNPWREVKHDLTQLVMGSFKDQVSALRDAVEGGLWTRNEAREVMGKNTMGPEGDEIVVNDKLRSLETVLESPAPALPGAQGPGPGGEPPQPAKPIPEKAKPSDVARMAVALDRFARKLEQRRKDLERKAPEKVEGNLATLRAEAMPGLIDECRKAAGLVDTDSEFKDAVSKAADSVIAGEPAHLAADRMVRE